MSSQQPDPVDLAARALRHRDRSRREIDERLEKVGIPEDVRTDALDTLERVGYVDDARFAAARAAALAGRGFGDEAIRHDLEQHGVGAEGAAEAIRGIESEAERARTLAGRLGRTAKTGGALARKGFAADSIEAALGEIAGMGPDL